MKGNNRVKSLSPVVFPELSRFEFGMICFSGTVSAQKNVSTLNFPSSVSLYGLSSSDCLLCRGKQPHFSVTIRDRGQ